MFLPSHARDYLPKHHCDILEAIETAPDPDSRYRDNSDHLPSIDWVYDDSDKYPITITVKALPDLFSITVKLVALGLGLPVVSETFQGVLSVDYFFEKFNVTVKCPLKVAKDEIDRMAVDDPERALCIEDNNTLLGTKYRESFVALLRPIASYCDEP